MARDQREPADRDRELQVPADKTPAADDPYAKPEEPGAYIGNRPERVAETIPGGVGPDDERIAAHSTQTAPLKDDSYDPVEPREAGQGR